METLTFDQLPNAVNQLFNKLENIERLLSVNTSDQHPEADRWLNLIELCAYLPDKPARPTVYGWVHDGLIPCHKGAKKLRFLKSDVDLWLKNGRKKTVMETAAEANLYLAKKKGAKA
ncbi:MAG TPA: helix-turn-helix domain-containing protein [Prolixibacteraceae bacterium]|jgi:excisionase family DNA binding protein